MSVIAGKSTAVAHDVFESVQQKWSSHGPGIPADQLSFLMQTGGSLISNNVVYLIFARSEQYPYWVVKIPRDPDCAISLLHEQEVLMDLQYFNQDKPAHDLIVPHFILGLDANNMPLYGQTAMRGESIGKLLHNGRFEMIARQITDAQISLAKYSKERSRAISGDKLANRLSAFLVDFSDGNLNPLDITQTRSLLSNMAALPPTYAHNDFAVWNMVAIGDGLGIYDWSDADRNGLPLLDLVYALSTAVFLMDNAHSAQKRQASYLRMLDPNTTAGSIVQDCLLRYAKEIGLDPTKIPTLRLLTWVLHSLYERTEYQREFGPDTHPSESVCTPLWKAELQLQKLDLDSHPVESEG